MARRLLLVGLAVVALGLWSAPASADEGWVIQRFASEITVQTDGSLRIVETIDVDFRGLQKHGIFRTIPVKYQWDETHVRVYRLTVRSVTDGPGRAVRYQVSVGGPNTVIKIGDPDVTVSGLRTYKLTYDVGGAMNPFSDHDELFWNVNGGNWPRSDVDCERDAPCVGRTAEDHVFSRRAGFDGTVPCHDGHEQRGFRDDPVASYR